MLFQVSLCHIVLHFQQRLQTWAWARRPGSTIEAATTTNPTPFAPCSYKTYDGETAGRAAHSLAISQQVISKYWGPSDSLFSQCSLCSSGCGDNLLQVALVSYLLNVMCFGDLYLVQYVPMSNVFCITLAHALRDGDVLVPRCGKAADKLRRICWEHEKQKISENADTSRCHRFGSWNSIYKSTANPATRTNMLFL